MSECVKAMLDFDKRQMNVKEVYANIADGNIASAKLAEKSGFEDTKETYFEDFHDQKYLHHIYCLKLNQ